MYSSDTARVVCNDKAQLLAVLIIRVLFVVIRYGCFHF